MEIEYTKIHIGNRLVSVDEYDLFSSEKSNNHINFDCIVYVENFNNWDYYECRSRLLNILREKKLKRILEDD